MEALSYTGSSKGNLTGYKSLSTTFTFMVKKNTVHCKHIITLTVILGYPEAILFRYTVWATRIEWSSFFLGNFLNFTIKFRCRSLINLSLLLQTKNTNSLQHTKCSNCIRFSRIFRNIERYFHMALSSKIINLIWLHLLNNANKRTAIRHISIMKIDQASLLHVTYPFVQI